MSKEEVFDEVKNIFKDIFDNPDLVIDYSTSSADIDDWDSFHHVTLIDAIEKEFKIKFSFAELVTLKNVGAMVDLMFKKII